MASSAGSLLIEIGANLARLQGDLGKMQHMVGKATGQIASAFKTLGVGIGASLSVAGLSNFIKDAINLGEQINKASQKFGIGTEALSALRYAAVLSDVAFEDLGVGLKKLSQNMAKGNEAFSTLGVNVRGAKGELRPTEEVLLDVAEAFAKYKDGAGKTAIAVELFGKQGANLIPLLNQGKTGVRELMEEARRLGLVIGKDAARQSEEFNDNLKRLKESASGVGISIANTVVPALDAMLRGILSINQAWREHKKAISESGIDMIAPMEGVFAVPDKPWEFGTSKAGVKPGEKKPELNFDPKAAEEKKKRDADALSRFMKEMGQRADVLQDFYGDEAEISKILGEEDIKRFEAWKKTEDEKVRYAQELRGTMDAMGVADFEADLADAMPKLDELALKMKSMTPIQILQEDFMVAFESGLVDEALERWNAGLGAHVEKLADAQTRIRNYQEIWRDMPKFAASAFGSMANSMLQFANAFGAHNKAFFRMFQVLAIAEATISAYAGATRALKDYPYPFSFIVAGITLAAGLANVATIASMKPAGAAHGGLDYVPAESTYLLDKGERVVSPKQNEDLTEFLSGASPAAPTGGDVYLDGDKVGRWFAKRSRQYGPKLSFA